VCKVIRNKSYKWKRRVQKMCVVECKAPFSFISINLSFYTSSLWFTIITDGIFNLVPCAVCRSFWLTSQMLCPADTLQEQQLSRRVMADSHSASRFRSVTVTSSFRQKWSLFTLSFVFIRHPQQHVIEGSRLFPSNMQPLPRNAFSDIC
jgi:hypothetical protein